MVRTGVRCEDRPIPFHHRRRSSWDWDPERLRHHHGRRPHQHVPLRRQTEERMLGGIAGTLAQRINKDVTLVRVGLVIFGLVSGIGVGVYVLVWLLLPADDGEGNIAGRALTDARGLALAVALVPPLLVIVLGARLLRVPWISSASWPIFVGLAGLVLIWRNGSAEDRAGLRRAAQPLLVIGGRRRWPIVVTRILVGLAMAAVGTWILTVGFRRSTLRPLGGMALLLAAIVLVFGPWWLTVGRELIVERQARIRAEERAELASRVHDSVLQTLAMIQRHADEPQRVAQLARAQERELRSWLFEGRPPGSIADAAAAVTVADAVRAIQAEVESTRGTAVEVVTVGDAQLTPGVEALLAAGREAAVNAATWSGAPVVSLFVEVEPEQVSLFVRDRGRGFDRTAVDPARKGVAESIEGRMARAGGTATIRTAPGEGTEVELTIDRGDRVGAGPRRPRR